MIDTASQPRLPREVLPETVQMRVYPSRSHKTLVHLPGVHGDWTLIGGFRRALGERVRFVEVTYPRTVSWSLDDYAAGIADSLADRGILRAWVLAESFGSQVLWPLVQQRKICVEGIVLAGGFARHPAPWMADLAALLVGRVSFKLLRASLVFYRAAGRFRFRHSPETLANMEEFVARRTEADCRAARHRLKLVSANKPEELVRQVNLPVYALAGLFDPIVPWLPARHWLRQNCTALADYRVIWRADHNVLGTAPKTAAAQILAWMGRH